MREIRHLAIAAVCAAFSVAGCGGGDSGAPPPPPPAITTQIFSDFRFDGDIGQTSPISYAVTQGMSPTVQSVFAGIEPLSRTEFRAFLDFPLTGAGGVPGDAIIDSAFLDLQLLDLYPRVGNLPILIELVSFQPPTLLGTDFDRSLQPPLASLVLSAPFSQVDIGTNVSIDVTPLMIEAQHLGLLDFQVRILEDLGPVVPTLAEINDATDATRASVGPLLTVTYL